MTGTKIKRTLRTAALGSILIVMVWAAGAMAVPLSPVSVSGNGWTVVADGEAGTFNVSFDGLGTILRDARLSLREPRGPHLFNNWSVEKKGEDELSIRTTEPPTVWLLHLKPNALQISSTASAGVVTAQAPAPAGRIVARLLDPQGIPVTWVGTDEVVGSYHGTETRNASFLPQRNPECAYFGLGLISDANLHSLFDRATDTAISFSNQARMQRSDRDPNMLDVTIAVPGNTLIRVFPRYFTDTLGVPYYVPFDDSNFPTAPMVWSTWTSYYDQVREEDVVSNARWLAAHLKPYGFEYVELDDGYERGANGEHYWIEKWDAQKFPHGPKWLADYIKSQGLRAGLWIVPNAYAGAVTEHPDWYLHYKSGKLVFDYQTPALDSTNPQVLQFLKREFTTLDDWGFDYYKFDGEHALPQYVPGVDLDRLYDESIDPLVAYRQRLELVRQTIGPKRFIEGCPSGTPLNGIGYFNSYFNGQDLCNNWQGMYSLFSSINANAFLNHLVVYTMPGEGLELGPPMSVAEAEKKRVSHVMGTIRTRENPLTGLGVTLPEARTLVSYVALTGVAYPLASVMPELPEERVQLLKKTMPTMPIFPVDLFSRGTDMRWDTFKHTTADDYIHNYPETLDLKVNAASGMYDVVGLTNWRSWTTTRELCFADKLGLKPGAPYIAFDFWRQKLLGVFTDRLEVGIEPHDTRVLLIHPVLNRPQLIGTSRHITGAYSIRTLAWDVSTHTLRGVSDTVADEPYTLWFYVPNGVTVSQVKATFDGNREIATQQNKAGSSLQVSFQGQQEPVNWEVQFLASSAR
jgi:hypothetical protein